MKMRTAYRRETAGARSFCVERAMNAICFFKKGCMVKKAESIRTHQSKARNVSISCCFCLWFSFLIAASRLRAASLLAAGS